MANEKKVNLSPGDNTNTDWHRRPNKMAVSLKPIGRNQTEMHLSDGTVILFSYETAVAVISSKHGYMVTEQKYSATTSRHINGWRGGILKDARQVPQGFIDAFLGVR